MAIPPEARAAAALAVRDNFLQSVYLPKGAALSAYMPFNGEMDTIPLVDALLQRGYTMLMPRTPPDQTIIEFRTWSHTTPMYRTMYGILEPFSEHSDSRIPDIFIMPLLAFDGKGNRLGYGAGYFDQTLMMLARGKVKFLTVGVAFQMQYYDGVPAETHDYTLDMCVTNEKVYDFRGMRK